MTAQLLSPQALTGERRIDAPHDAAWYRQSIEAPAMSFYRHQTLGAASMIPAPAMRVPMGRMSCPYSHRGSDVRPHEETQPHRSFRAFGARCGDATRRWSVGDVLSTDFWHPPTSTRQHGRQRILAVILAIILAALLAQLGW